MNKKTLDSNDEKQKEEAIKHIDPVESKQQQVVGGSAIQFLSSINKKK